MDDPWVGTPAGVPCPGLILTVEGLMGPGLGTLPRADPNCGRTHGAWARVWAGLALGQAQALYIASLIYRSLVYWVWA